MNYQKIYDNIVADARQNPPTGYTEDHHIIPRCMEGTDVPENIVTLSARQHFICHWLLIKMHPKNPDLWYAFHLMFHPTSAGTRQTDWTTSRSRVYARNKERLAEATSQRFKGVPKTEEHKERIRQGTFTRWTDQDARDIQATKLMGNKHGLGKTHTLTDEAKRKISEANKLHHQTHPHPRLGKKHSPETIAKMKETKRLNPFKASPEQRAKRSQDRMGFKQPDSQKRKVAAAMSATWDVTTPSGERLTITNLRRFCLAHGLNQGNLCTYGKTKGFTATKLSA